MATLELSARGEFVAIKPYAAAIPSLEPQSVSLPQVDLRPAIEQLGLAVRNQGARGTCSVFVMTFLLEYTHRSQLEVQTNDLSEEYLNYAANQVSNNPADGDFFDKLDAGYQAFGMCKESDVPYRSTPVTTVSSAIVDSARRWTRLRADFIKPWDATKGASTAQIDQAIAYLDHGLPVGFGGWWPDSTAFGTTTINGVAVMNVPPISQKGSGVFDGHSIALVGYRRDNAFSGGGYFVFRNSWGSGWGDKGYGYMPFAYVQTYANDLVAYTFKQISSARVGLQAVADGPDRLHVFVTDAAGEVHGAAWQQGVAAGRWRGWWSVLGGRSKKGAPVGVAARSPHQLDLFVSGTDGKTYTAAWDRNVADAQWRGWWNILAGHIPAGGAISVVARDANKLDIFLVSTDGGVYTAAWDQSAANAQWQGWWRIGTLVAQPGAPVAAVARDAGKLDIFVAANDGKVYTASWDRAVPGGWSGWRNILTGHIPVGGAISVVARDANKLDIFLVSTDGGVYTAAWDQFAANAQWQGWWRIGTLVAQPGAPVAAVARDAGKLDIFVVGLDGAIHTAAWDRNVTGGWRGWWRILNGVATPGTGIAAVSRDPTKLDVFIVGADGGIWTAAWDHNIPGGWRGWWKIGP